MLILSASQNDCFPNADKNLNETFKHRKRFLRANIKHFTKFLSILVFKQRKKSNGTNNTTLGPFSFVIQMEIKKSQNGGFKVNFRL